MRTIRAADGSVYQENDDGSHTLITAGTGYNPNTSQVTGLSSPYKTQAGAKPIDKTKENIAAVQNAASLVDKAGEKSDVNWAGNIATGAAAGATAGATIGSVVPVIGTTVGGVVGGVLGALGGTAQSVVQQNEVTSKNISKENAARIGISQGEQAQNELTAEQGRNRVANDINTTRALNSDAATKAGMRAFSIGLARAYGGK